MKRDAGMVPGVSSTQEPPSRETFDAPSVCAMPIVVSASTKSGSANLLRITAKSEFLYFYARIVQSQIQPTSDFRKVIGFSHAVQCSSGFSRCRHLSSMPQILNQKKI